MIGSLIKIKIRAFNNPLPNYQICYKGPKSENLINGLGHSNRGNEPITEA